MTTAQKESSLTDLIRDAFTALDAHRIDELAELWDEKTVEDFVALGVFNGKPQIRGYFAELFAAFPDFSMEVERTLEQDQCVVVQWSASGTFTGARFQGMAPNGARVAFRGCDVFEMDGGLVARNTIYFDGAGFARQLGMLPPRGSGVEGAMLAGVNALTALRSPQQPAPRQAPAGAPLPPKKKSVKPAELFASYLQAIEAKDIARIAAHWHPDAKAEVLAQGSFDGPDGIATFFSEIFHAFPDFELTVDRTVEQDSFLGMQWHARATFTGGRFQGLAPNGRKIEMRGIDVFEADGNRWRSNTVYYDGAGLMRQLGVLPASDSTGDRAVTGAFNGFTKLKGLLGR